MKVMLLDTSLKGEVARLGFWSKQGMEAGHFDFKEEWGKVKLPTSHPDNRENLEKSLVRYNGKHE